MARYTHILFDHDGVLVDTEHLYYEATREVLALHGVELDLPQYLQIQAVGGNAWAPLERMGYDADAVAEGRAQRNARYQQLLQTRPIDIPGVEAVLEELSARCTLAIVTTARQSDFDLIHRDAQPRNIVPYMSLVLTNQDYARSKPHPDPYLTALERLEVPAERALVVEDSERGLKAAVAAGIDCATVHHPFTAPQDFSAATYRIDSLTDLVGLLDRAQP